MHCRCHSPLSDMILLATSFLERLSDWCSAFMENFIFIVMGLVFVAFLVIAVVGMCLGMNLGPKNKID